MLKKPHLFSLLESSDDAIRYRASKGIGYLINIIFDSNERQKVKLVYSSLLKSKNKKIREGTWNIMLNFAKYNLITNEDQDLFLELLVSSDTDIRWDAWKNISDYIEYNVVSASEVKKRKDHFLAFAKSDKASIIHFLRWIDSPMIIKTREEILG
jgi:hypothetical protein